MSKMLHVAVREFLATVATKGFIIGMLVTPLLIAIMIVVMPRLINEAPPRVEGELAVIDPTGEVAPGVREYLKPEALALRREEFRKNLEEATPEALRKVSGVDAQTRQALDAALGEVPKIDVVALDPGVDLETAKAPLREAREQHEGESEGRLALIVVHPDAVTPASEGATYGGYDLFVKEKLDDRIDDEIRSGVREAIVDARIRASGLDREAVQALTHVDRARSTTVSASGERETNRIFQMLLPAVMMGLLLMSVLTSGQYLLTSTVEEKSNRVVEVLLSAVSPMQLMVGKILGQMAVGILILILYAGLAVAALMSFAMMGLLDIKLVILLFVFYLLAYLTIASFMAAIGSAVNEMREAQTLMTPVMVLIMIPWMLWMPISRDPNSTFATVMSFLPPVSNFVILLRLASSSPPPMWQVLLALIAGAAGAFVAVWFAAKVFRIGLLMYGKPPSFATLVRWARMA